MGQSRLKQVQSSYISTLYVIAELLGGGYGGSVEV